MAEEQFSLHVLLSSTHIMNLALQIDLNQTETEMPWMNRCIHSFSKKADDVFHVTSMPMHMRTGIYDNTQCKRKEVTLVIVVYINDNLKSKLTQFTFLMHFTGLIVDESSVHVIAQKEMFVFIFVY